MAAADEMKDVERRLALAYAPADAREALATLWVLDERLGSIALGGGQPTLAAIKLAWWREALETLDRGRAPAEPLLQAIASAIIPRGVSGTALGEIEAGWGALLEEPVDEAALRRHAEARGGRLFALATAISGAATTPAIEAEGERWALVDLARTLPTDADRSAALALAAEQKPPPPRWPRSARALGVLATLAARDARRGFGKLEPRGAPARVVRALWFGMSGR